MGGHALFSPALCHCIGTALETYIKRETRTCVWRRPYHPATDVAYNTSRALWAFPS